MSSTNKTTNYELSQFLGSDKPTWLSDYNADMSKIDAQMKLNADGVTTASGAASTATTNIGTMANLSTTDKTSLVGAVNEVNTAVGTAQSTANTANTTANGCRTDLNKFNLTTLSTLTATTNLGTLDPLTLVQYAGDSSNSIFKVYGRIQVSGLNGTSGNLNVKVGDTPLRPDTAYTINSACTLYVRDSAGTYIAIGSRGLKVNTDGSIYVVGYGISSDYTTPLDGSSAIVDIIISPCLYFNTNFGD